MLGHPLDRKNIEERVVAQLLFSCVCIQIEYDRRWLQAPGTVCDVKCGPVTVFCASSQLEQTVCELAAKHLGICTDATSITQLLDFCELDSEGAKTLYYTGTEFARHLLSQAVCQEIKAERDRKILVLKCYQCLNMLLLLKQGLRVDSDYLNEFIADYEFDYGTIWDRNRSTVWDMAPRAVRQEQKDILVSLVECGPSMPHIQRKVELWIYHFQKLLLTNNEPVETVNQVVTC